MVAVSALGYKTMVETVAPDRLVVGKDLGLLPASSDMAVVGDFEDKDEFDRYYSSEARRSVVENLVNPAAAYVSDGVVLITFLHSPMQECGHEGFAYHPSLIS